MLKLLRKIFLITNEDEYKVVVIFGMKFKSKRKDLVCKNLEKEVESLKNIINLTVDVTNLPPAKGVLADIQKANYNILQEVDRVCRENNIPYWLNFGSLLGAVRHKGFIPWDDDIDISMLREDYERFAEIFNKSTVNKNYYAELYSHEDGCFNLLKVYDKRKDNCLFLDIFPYDFYYKKLTTDEKLELTKRLKAMHCLKTRKNLNDFSSIEELHNYYKELFKQQGLDDYEKEVTDKPTLYWGCEYYHYRWENAFYEWDEIFPLKEIEFNGKKYFCPNKTSDVLHRVYGDYMVLPKTIKLHSDINQFNVDDMIELGEIANGN